MSRSDSRSRERPTVVPYERERERERNKLHEIEQEKRINSNALAKEFKRRSYQEQMYKVRSILP